jgi:hypothetical protein
MAEMPVCSKRRVPLESKKLVRILPALFGAKRQKIRKSAPFV